jgi:hypothetical protein
MKPWMYFLYKPWDRASCCSFQPTAQGRTSVAAEAWSAELFGSAEAWSTPATEPGLLAKERAKADHRHRVVWWGLVVYLEVFLVVFQVVQKGLFPNPIRTSNPGPLDPGWKDLLAVQWVHWDLWE